MPRLEFTVGVWYCPGIRGLGQSGLREPDVSEPPQQAGHHHHVAEVETMVLLTFFVVRMGCQSHGGQSGRGRAWFTPGSADSGWLFHVGLLNRGQLTGIGGQGGKMRQGGSMAWPKRIDGTGPSLMHPSSSHFPHCQPMCCYGTKNGETGASSSSVMGDGIKCGFTCKSS